MAQLALFLFGPPRIELDGTPVKVSRHKAIALLAYLVVTAETHSRNTLATLLWPDYDQTRARAALRRTLVTFNKTGISTWLETERETIGLNPEANIQVDVILFHHYLTQCLAAKEDTDAVCLPLLTKAINLYHADFMAGFTLRDSPAFDEWQRVQTENLSHDLTSALARLIRCYSNKNDFKPAIVCAQRWLQIDPYYELAQRQLMKLYAWDNQRAAALRQYEACVRILKSDLDVPPSEETSTLYERIQQGEIVHRQQKAASRQITISLPLDTALHNFPAQPTPFIGRQQSLAEITKRVTNPECRLLTLTGPGGIGKTRLAIQTAIKQNRNFPDGLYFIPLTSVKSSDYLIQTLAESIHFPLENQGDSQLQLLNYLQHKKMLLVMDNFEHLTNEVGIVVGILKHAPDIKILITSRERLNLQDEWVFEVKGMQYPSDDISEDIESYSSVALFLHRAYRVNSDFSLSPTEKPYIVRICQLLEGIPLGIELAATWVRVLSCQEIAHEIEKMYTPPHNLDFLVTSLQDVPQRHQSLRLVFEHSWELLTEDEQRIFSQLSVFEGGCSRKAIETITGASLFLISALVDKSLLMRSRLNRYEMHEVLRQYAIEKLWQTTSEVEQIQNRHCDYYTTFLQKRETRLKSERQKETLAEIAREIDNIRASWKWAISQQNLDKIEKALDALWYFYAMYGWFREGAEMLGKAFIFLPEDEENADTQTRTLIGKLRTNQGWFFLRQGLYQKANILLQQSITSFEKLNDSESMAGALHYMGILVGELGKPAESRQFMQKSLDIYRQTNNRWAIAWCLSNLAYRTSELGEANQAEGKRLLQESLAIYKELGHQQGIAGALNNLGYMHYRQKNYGLAQKLLKESLVLRRQVGYPRGIAVTLNNLGHITAALADYATAKVYYYESLKIASDIQTVPLLLAAVGGLAVPYSHEAKLEQAAEFLLFVLQHPASNKETLDRAITTLEKVKSQIPSEIFTTIQTQVKENPRTLKTIVTDILNQT